MSITVNPEQLLHDSAVVPAGAAPRLHPWQEQPPAFLYKYYPPERFHVLTDCAVRFSQREVFDDQYDLRPDVDNFGTDEEIRAFMDSDPVLSEYPNALKIAVINHVLGNRDIEQALIRQAQEALTAPEEFGVFCLCENAHSRKMWDQYADRGRGFLVVFRTTHEGFTLLRTPGRIGRVLYSDQRISSFLTRYGATSFFQKKERYRFEAEWRSVRALRNFKRVLRPENAPPIYLSAFGPSCISELRILPGCAIEWKLRTLVAVDARYRHANISIVDGTVLR